MSKLYHLITKKELNKKARKPVKVFELFKNNVKAIDVARFINFCLFFKSYSVKYKY